MARFKIPIDLISLGAKVHFPEGMGHVDMALKSTPDWLRRGIRLSLCLVLFGMLGHAIEFPTSWGASLNTEVKQACNWAAITCIVSTIGHMNMMSNSGIQPTGMCTFAYDPPSTLLYFIPADPAACWPMQVVTAPFLGKVSEVSVYRIIGTACGGFWGFAMVRFEIQGSA